MIDHMFDLRISALADGGFELEQLAGSLEEPEQITLHPAQVRLLAERAGLLPAPDPSLLDRLSAAHVRRLHALRDRINHIYDFYHDEILNRCGAGIEISLHLEAISDLVDDLLDGLGAAPQPEQEVAKQADPQGAPSGNLFPEEPHETHEQTRAVR